jgi:outer membrane protein TolC
MKALAVALGIALLCRAATPVCAQQGPQFVLSLAQALDLAKRNNPDFQAAQQDVRAAQARTPSRRDASAIVEFELFV